jgi:hypothetical protein
MWYATIGYQITDITIKRTGKLSVSYMSTWYFTFAPDCTSD